MNIFEIPSYLVLGIGSGIIGGLLGIGGGVVIVPCLLLIFSLLGFPEGEETMDVVIATSLAATALNTLSASYYHNKEKTVDRKTVQRMLLGIVPGAFLGSFIAEKIPGDWLKILFAGFVFLIAVRFFFGNGKPSSRLRLKPSGALLTTAGGLIACLSNLLGVGGGVFTVPLLTFLHLPPRTVIGTSSCLSFFMSFLGTCIFLSGGKGSPPLGFGYVYLPAFAAVGIAGFFSARYGVELSKTMPIPRIRKIFALCMLWVAIFMTASAVGRG